MEEALISWRRIADALLALVAPPPAPPLAVPLDRLAPLEDRADELAVGGALEARFRFVAAADDMLVKAPTADAARWLREESARRVRGIRECGHCRRPGGLVPALNGAKKPPVVTDAGNYGVQRRGGRGSPCPLARMPHRHPDRLGLEDEPILVERVLFSSPVQSVKIPSPQRLCDEEELLHGSARRGEHGAHLPGQLLTARLGRRVLLLHAP